MTTTIRLITKRELCAMVPYTPQHILRLETQNKFPKRVHVGENRVAWVMAEIETWIAARTSARTTPGNTPVMSP
jgi:prophage regulatory protein